MKEGPRATSAHDAPGSRFDVALVCANGHLLNDLAASDPGRNAKFCPACGEGTLSACPECSTPIRGRLSDSGPLRSEDCSLPGSRDTATDTRRFRDPGGWGGNAGAGPWGNPLPVPPAYCHECGEAFPWTAERLRAADELADQLDDLSEDERRLLRLSFRDIITENPRTEVAALRVKRVAEEAGKGAGQVLLQVAGNLATETARRLIFGS